MAWNVDAFSRSLGGLSPETVRAYTGDVRAFGEWAGRGGITGPAGVDRLLLRRYLAYLSTRRHTADHDGAQGLLPALLLRLVGRAR